MYFVFGTMSSGQYIQTKIKYIIIPNRNHLLDTLPFTPLEPEACNIARPLNNIHKNIQYFLIDFTIFYSHRQYTKTHSTLGCCLFIAQLSKFSHDVIKIDSGHAMQQMNNTKQHMIISVMSKSPEYSHSHTQANAPRTLNYVLLYTLSHQVLDAPWWLVLLTLLYVFLIQKYKSNSDSSLQFNSSIVH